MVLKKQKMLRKEMNYISDDFELSCSDDEDDDDEILIS